MHFLFDEMPVKKVIEYNRKLDIIEVFQDLGTNKRNSIFGGQALVLMFRGAFSQ